MYDRQTNEQSRDKIISSFLENALKEEVRENEEKGMQKYSKAF